MSESMQVHAAESNLSAQFSDRRSLPVSLAHALQYRERGFALLPIAPGTKMPHNALLPVNPRTGKPSWKPLAERPASEHQIREWFEKDPMCGIAVICGRASGGLVVVDFDTTQYRKFQLPLTPMVQTRRGIHIYFKISRSIRNQILETNSGQHIGEIRSEGQYVLLPPSMHPTGVPYQWYDFMSPQDLELAEPPEWVFNFSQKDVAARTIESREGKQVDISTCLPRGFHGEGLVAWDMYPPFIAAAAKMLGIPPKAAMPKGIGQTFLCILPGHEEKHPSASLHRAGTGVVFYVDWHQDGKVYSLAEVRASLAYKEATKLSPSNLAVWHLRMLVESGFAVPAAVNMPSLPTDASNALRKIYDGFRLLLECRWLYTYGAPTPFTWRFAAAWCGVSERHAGEAIKKLLGLGIIRKIESFKIHGKSITLFLPGNTSN